MGKCFGGSNGRENRSQGCSPVFGAVLDCVHTALVHRHLVVELRAVWRCVAYDGGVVGCKLVVGWERGGMRAGLGCERGWM